MGKGFRDFSYKKFKFRNGGKFDIKLRIELLYYLKKLCKY